MEFYEVIQKRRTYREFTSEDVAQEVLDRILHAGLQAPTNDHLRNWEFVVLHTQQEKENALQFVKEWAEKQSETKLQGGATSAQKMYAYAMPRQYTMLASCPYVILPFFKAAPGVFAPHFGQFSQLICSHMVRYRESFFSNYRRRSGVFYPHPCRGGR